MTKSDSADKLEFEVLCFSKFLKYKGKVLHIMNLVVVPQVVLVGNTENQQLCQSA